MSYYVFIAMTRHRKINKSLLEKYPPSPPCSCTICLSYCSRPGWWTVAEAEQAIAAGFGPRMMLEMSPDCTYGVLSPAFRGCEGDFAREIFSDNGCTYLQQNLCELHGPGYQPLECRYCHHERIGSGPQCHADIAKDWNSSAGRSLVVRWCKLTGLWQRLQRLFW
jgi:hypothetical protein